MGISSCLCLIWHLIHSIVFSIVSSVLWNIFEKWTEAELLKRSREREEKICNLKNVVVGVSSFASTSYINYNQYCLEAHSAYTQQWTVHVFFFFIKLTVMRKKLKEFTFILNMCTCNGQAFTVELMRFCKNINTISDKFHDSLQWFKKWCAELIKHVMEETTTTKLCILTTNNNQ